MTKWSPNQRRCALLVGLGALALTLASCGLPMMGGVLAGVLFFGALVLGSFSLTTLSSGRESSPCSTIAEVPPNGTNVGSREAVSAAPALGRIDAIARLEASGALSPELAERWRKLPA